MKLWGYYAFHTFINSVKKMFRSTFIIVLACIIGVSILFGVAGGVIGWAVADNMITEYAYDENGNYVGEELGKYDEDGNYIEDEDAYLYDKDGNYVGRADGEYDKYGNYIDDGGYDENGSYVGADGEYNANGERINGELTDEDKAAAYAFVEFGVEALFIIFIFIGMYGGQKNGNEMFLLADVNFLFTAPKKPQTVMVFRLSFQMLTLLLISLYMVFQIPNMMINLGLSVGAVVALLIAWAMILVWSQLISVFIYTLRSIFPKLQRLIIPLMFVIAAVFIVPGLISLVNHDNDVVYAVQHVYCAKWTWYIPFIGWLKAVVMSAIAGNAVTAVIYGVLFVVCSVIIFWAIWKVDADFYEDAMEGAKIREVKLENQKAGKSQNAGLKKNKEKKAHHEAVLKGSGASAFFTKQVYIRRRFAYGGLVTKTMLIYTATVLAVSLLFTQVIGYDGFIIPAITIMIIIYINNVGNPIAQETSKNWLFLVPDSAYRKVFYAVASVSYNTAIDILPAVIIGAVLSDDGILMVVLSYITMLSIDFMLSTTGLFLEAMLPTDSLDTVKSTIQVMLKMIILVVLVIVFAVGMILGGYILALVVNTILCLAVGIAIAIAYPAMLHNGIG